MTPGAGDAELVTRALAREPAALRALVDRVLPVVHARVARALVRRGRAEGRDLRQEVEDLSQEVFVALFADGGRALRAWDGARGLSLPNFVGLLAEREVASVLRSGRRSPFTESPTELEDLEAAVPPTAGPEPAFASRELLDAILGRVREALTPKGLELFERLIVDEEPVEAVCAATGMTADAVYAWRSRLGKLVRKATAEVQAERSSDPGGSRRTPPAAAS